MDKLEDRQVKLGFNSKNQTLRAVVSRLISNFQFDYGSKNINMEYPTDDMIILTFPSLIFKESFEAELFSIGPGSLDEDPPWAPCKSCGCCRW